MPFSYRQIKYCAKVYKNKNKHLRTNSKKDFAYKINYNLCRIIILSSHWNFIFLLFLAMPINCIEMLRGLNLDNWTNKKPNKGVNLHA